MRGHASRDNSILDLWNWNIYQVGSNYAFLSQKKINRDRCRDSKKVFLGVCRRLSVSKTCIS